MHLRSLKSFQGSGIASGYGIVFMGTWKYDFPVLSGSAHLMIGEYRTTWAPDKIDQNSAAFLSIVEVVHRLPSGDDKVISYPHLYETAPSVKIASDPRMVSLTVEMALLDAAADFVLQIFTFDPDRPGELGIQDLTEERIRRVAVYRPEDGRIVHLHHVVTIGAAPLSSPEEMNEAVLGFVEARGLPRDRAAVLDLGTRQIDPRAAYHVDPATRALVETSTSHEALTRLLTLE
jgi:hypothetical protein